MCSILKKYIKAIKVFKANQSSAAVVSKMFLHVNIYLYILAPAKSTDCKINVENNKL